MLGTHCPKCKWKLPLLSGEIRNKRAPFACPNCTEKLIYNANVGLLGGLTGGSAVFFMLIYHAINPSSAVKLIIAAIALLFAFIFFYRERLELYKEDA